MGRGQAYRVLHRDDDDADDDADTHELQPWGAVASPTRPPPARRRAPIVTGVRIITFLCLATIGIIVAAML